MNSFIWCVVGLLVGGFVAMTGAAQGFVERAETIGVAVFGAFVGGDFLGSVLSATGPGDTGFHASSLGLALAGAAVMLGLLALMRRRVGKLRPHKRRRS